MPYMFCADRPLVASTSVPLLSTKFGINPRFLRKKKKDFWTVSYYTVPDTNGSHRGLEDSQVAQAVLERFKNASWIADFSIDNVRHIYRRSPAASYFTVTLPSEEAEAALRAIPADGLLQLLRREDRVARYLKFTLFGVPTNLTVQQLRDGFKSLGLNAPKLRRVLRLQLPSNRVTVGGSGLLAHWLDKFTLTSKEDGSQVVKINLCG